MVTKVSLIFESNLGLATSFLEDYGVSYARISKEGIEGQPLVRGTVN